MYSRSSRTQSLKSLTLLRPLTCHRQVRPGLTLSRRRCARSSNRLTSSTGSGRGPDQAHLPAQHVEQLGQFVQAEFAQEPARRGDPRIVGHLEHRPGHLVQGGQLVLELLGVGHHRAELVNMVKAAR